MRAATVLAAAKPFLTVTAADLMSAPVMTIPHETSLREAARLLSRTHVSGAPVVDGEGRCIGILSSSDFVTWAVRGSGADENGGEVTAFIAPWGEVVTIDNAPESEIHRYMTAQPVTVTPTTPIGELSQKMVDAHIHRVLVVGEQNRPCGVVTSTDVLAAVAREHQRASHGPAGTPKPQRRSRH